MHFYASFPGVGQSGSRSRTLAYWQTPSQHATEVTEAGGDRLQGFKDEKSAIEVRRRLISTLKEQGHSDFQVALIPNTSEHEVQKLKRVNELPKPKRSSGPIR